MNGSPESETDAVVAATCAPLNAKVDEAVAIAPVIEKHSLSRQSHEVVVAIEAAGVSRARGHAANFERQARGCDRRWDSCRIAAGEQRRLANQTASPVMVLLVMPLSADERAASQASSFVGAHRGTA